MLRRSVQGSGWRGDEAIDMALRAVGRSRAGVADEALAVATRLAASDEPARRRIGRKALKELS